MKRIMSILVNASLCVYLLVGQNVPVQAGRPASQAGQQSALAEKIYLPLVLKTQRIAYKAISVSTGMFDTVAPDATATETVSLDAAEFARTPARGFMVVSHDNPSVKDGGEAQLIVVDGD